MSANLPPIPAFQCPGWDGTLNGATGPPLSGIFKLSATVQTIMLARCRSHEGRSSPVADVASDLAMVAGVRTVALQGGSSAYDSTRQRRRNQSFASCPERNGRKLAVAHTSGRSRHLRRRHCSRRNRLEEWALAFADRSPAPFRNQVKASRAGPEHLSLRPPIRS